MKLRTSHLLATALIAGLAAGSATKAFADDAAAPAKDKAAKECKKGNKDCKKHKKGSCNGCGKDAGAAKDGEKKAE